MKINFRKIKKIISTLFKKTATVDFFETRKSNISNLEFDLDKSSNKEPANRIQGNAEFMFRVDDHSKKIQ